jgi:HAD superfamily hydrolase (TIGR01484 family)
MPCTGRTYESVVTMFHDNGLFQNEPIPFPMVTQNGSSIHLPGGKIEKYHRFPSEVQDRLLEIFRQFPRACFMLMEKFDTILLWPNDFGTYWINRFRTRWIAYDETCKGRDFGKATCLSEDRDILQDLASRLDGFPVELGLSLSCVFDINPQGISKRTGVIQLMEALHLEQTSIFAAGDGENDLDLFTLAKVTFSPITAVGRIREQAGQVVNTHQDGLLSTMLENAGCL